MFSIIWFKQMNADGNDERISKGRHAVWELGAELLLLIGPIVSSAFLFGS